MSEEKGRNENRPKKGTTLNPPRKLDVSQPIAGHDPLHGPLLGLDQRTSSQPNMRRKPDQRIMERKQGRSEGSLPPGKGETKKSEAAPGSRNSESPKWGGAGKNDGQARQSRKKRKKVITEMTGGSAVDHPHRRNEDGLAPGHASGRR